MKKKTLRTKVVGLFMLMLLSISIFAMPVLAAPTEETGGYEIVLDNTAAPLPDSAAPLPDSKENTPSSASAKPGSVASVVNDAYNDVKSQAEVVFFKVIVNALRVILLIGLFIVCGFAWRNHHQGQGVNWLPVVFIGVCLALSLVLPELLWDLA